MQKNEEPQTTSNILEPKATWGAVDHYLPHQGNPLDYVKECDEVDENDDADQAEEEDGADQAEGEVGATKRPDISPAIYLARLTECVAEVEVAWQVTFRFEIVRPMWERGALVFSVDTEWPDGRDYLSRVFAVAGLVVLSPVDLPVACREIVGKYFYVELGADGRMHVQQLATTFALTLPLREDSPFPDHNAVEAMQDREEIDEDPTRSAYPNFFACDEDLKADLQLHPIVRARMARAEI
jgi:hypothetical protein